MASIPIAMASNLIAMASNLIARSKDKQLWNSQYLVFSGAWMSDSQASRTVSVRLF